MKMYNNPKTEQVMLDSQDAVLLGAIGASALGEQLAPSREASSGNRLQNVMK